MKKFLSLIMIFFLLSTALPATALAQKVLVPVGKLVGLHIKDDTVTVAAFDEALGAAAQEAGLRVGDELVEIDGRSIKSAADIQDVLSADPRQVELTIARGGRRKNIQLEPPAGKTGRKLGVYLRQGISGIGTLTWYDPDHKTFGSLGHGVSSRQGMLLKLQEGTVCSAEVAAVIPGQPGQPGLLKGRPESENEVGTLYRNTPQGVFGKAKADWLGQVLPVASFSQVHTGPASIRSTVSGREPQDYSVEILKIYPETREDCRNFLLKVTDPQLLSITGGIVQGMSGSPIIQDGRLIGAVTHVMVSDPTTGYGIFIGNMLDAAA